MRVLRNLLILLGILVVVAFFVPPEIRDGYYYLFWGKIVEMTGDTAGAAESFKTSSEAAPENPLFARHRARALNDLAEATESEEKYQEAFDFTGAWIDAHEFDPGVWQLHIERARAEWGLGRKNPARTSIDKAVDLRPTDYTALVYQGIMHRDYRPDDRNLVATAIPIFEQAIQVRRQSRTSWAHLELAKTYWMLGDENNALNQVSQTIAQFPPRDIRDEAERLRTEIQSSGRAR
jgi:tetratricopeptide (TPR) repeat protein